MKWNKVILIAATLITAIGAGTYFYMKNAGNAYLNVLPDNAVGMARIDVKTFLDEAEMTVADCVKSLEKSQDVDVQKIGLDLSRPAYAFASASGNFGFVASMDDEDDFASLCSDLHNLGRASTIVHQRGYSWVILEQQWLCAFDGTLALVMGPAVGAAQDQLRNEMARLLKQDKEDSGLKTKMFAELRRKEGSVVAVVGPEILPAKARVLLYKFDITTTDDALLRLHLSADKNVLSMNTEVVAMKDEVKEQLRLLGKTLRPIKGELLSRAHDSTIAWLGMNIEGRKLLDMLRSVKKVRLSLAAMNLVLDLDRIIEAIDGDVAIEMTPSTNSSRRDPLLSYLSGMNLSARVANTDFFKGAASWGNSLVGVKEEGHNEYFLSWGEHGFYLGVDGGILYAGDQKVQTKDGNPLLNNAKGHIKGAHLYASFSIPDLLNNLYGLQSLPEIVRKFESMTLEMRKPDQLFIELKAPEGTLIAKELLTNE